MKSRRIKKLRKIVSKYKPFIVSTSSYIFGFNYDCDGIYPDEVMAIDAKDAIRKYFRKYSRRYNEKSIDYTKYPYEENKRWAKIMVIDYKEYRTYWR